MSSFHKKKYKDTLMKYELKEKGPIRMTVWDDDDGISADFIARLKVPISQILSSPTKETRSMVDNSSAGTDEDPGQTLEKLWFTTPHLTKVYPTSKQQLETEIAATGMLAPYIYFEAYFIPPMEVELDDSEEAGARLDGDVWKETLERWEKGNDVLKDKFAHHFPDSIGARPQTQAGDHIPRRFTAFVTTESRRYDAGETKTPLNAYLQPIIVPDDLGGRPSKLLHWISSISFETPSKQSKTGLIDAWKDPSELLTKRKGPVQDHALLLCCVLLGCKKDAFICKGLVNVSDSDNEHATELVEHVWVMHREEKDGIGWVVFWEPVTRTCYHLRNRWTPNTGKEKKKKRPKATHQEPEEKIISEVAEHPETEVLDAIVTEEDMELLPSIGRSQPRPKTKQRRKGQETEARKKEAERAMVGSSEFSVTPDKRLYKGGNIVNWLPYESIEVVANFTNVWANEQNQNPACIMYDITETDNNGHWRPLLRKGDPPVEYVTALDISVRPPERQEKAEKVAHEIVSEVYETLRLARGEKGLDTFQDDRRELLDVLHKYLEIQERFLQIDPNVAFEEETIEESLCKHTSMNEATKELVKKMAWDKKQLKLQSDNLFKTQDQHSSYFAYNKTVQNISKKMISNLHDLSTSLATFPCKRGHDFKGFDLHFNTADLADVRHGLQSISEYRHLVELQDEWHRNVYFTVCCVVNPLMGGVFSVWVYIGHQKPSQRSTEEG